MNFQPKVLLLAQYNRWMNQKCYAAAAKLTAGDLTQDRGAFFGSIIGTLNHIMVGDTIWLARFSRHCGNHGALDAYQTKHLPAALDATIATDLTALHAEREQTDATILHWAGQLTEHDLEQPLSFKNMAGVAHTKDFASLVLHFFNHQTHHRGQLSTLLLQAGQDIGITDLGMYVMHDGNVEG